MKNNGNRNQQYVAVLTVRPNGSIKVKLAKKLRAVNQYKNSYFQVNARQFARQLNNSKLVIN